MSLFDHFLKNSNEKNDKNKNGAATETWKLTVHGVVQGVGFRWSVQNVAQELHLNGTVRNNPDMTVTITLQASQAEVDDFIRELPRRMSSFAQIEKIDKEKLAGVEKMHGFHVLY